MLYSNYLAGENLRIQHRVIYGVKSWSGVYERSSGVESGFGVAKVEWSAVVMCV